MVLVKKIIFRADASQSIGMGHFIRTLALAEMLNEHFFCIFATQTPTQYQIKEIDRVCHKRIDLPANENHFKVFLNLLKGDEIVVLDNYYFTTNYQFEIKTKGCQLVCIDDIHDKHFVADIVINHAEGISQDVYSAEDYTRFLLGNKYALLRKQFLNDIKDNSEKHYASFIMMGGADPFNLIEKFALVLDDFDFSEPTLVISGHNNLRKHKLRRSKKIVYYNEISSSQIFQLMQESRFGILPASTIAIEACAARLPFICGYFVENQKEIYSGIKKNNLAICVDNFLEIDDKLIKEGINKICNTIISDKIISQQISKLDKKSKERIIKVFQQL